MNVVGIDLSIANTGMARYDDEVWSPDVTDSPVSTWLIHTDPKDYVEKGRWADDFRLFNIIEHVVDGIGNPDLVVMEGLSFQSKGTSVAQLSALHFMVRAALLNEGVEPVILTPGQLKKLACGKGNVGKVEVIVAARERLGFPGHNDNGADARWLLEAGLHLIKHPAATELPKTHMSALEDHWN